MNTTKNIEQIKLRRWGIGAAVALLLCSGTVSGLWYQQRRAASGEEQTVSLEPTQIQVDQRVERLKVLREKWRPWALRHKVELKQMLSAAPSDQTVAVAVQKAVPAFPSVEDAGFTLNDVNQKAGDTQGFTWTGMSNGLKSDNESDAEFADYQKSVAERTRDNFATLRDVSLSQSVNTGRLETTLWVSGRITQRKWLSQDLPSQPSMVLGPYQEVVPPYDFLKP